MFGPLRNTVIWMASNSIGTVSSKILFFNNPKFGRCITHTFASKTGTVQDCRNANVVGIRNVNTVFLDRRIVIFKSF